MLKQVLRRVGAGILAFSLAFNTDFRIVAETSDEEGFKEDVSNEVIDRQENKENDGGEETPDPEKSDVPEEIIQQTNNAGEGNTQNTEGDGQDNENPDTPSETVTPGEGETPEVIESPDPVQTQTPEQTSDPEQKQGEVINPEETADPSAANPTPTPSPTVGEENEEGSTAMEAAESPKETEYSYEDDDVIVTAALEKAEAVPDEAKLFVVRVTSSSDDYDYDGYMNALNANSDQEYSSENTLLYDISFRLDDEEYEPEDGSFSIKIDFKDNTLKETFGEANESEVEIKHLPENDGDITVEDVTDPSVSMNDEAVEFTTDSLSVFALAVPRLLSSTEGTYTFEVDVQDSEGIHISDPGITDANYYALGTITVDGTEKYAFEKLDFNSADAQSISFTSFRKDVNDQAVPYEEGMDVELAIIRTSDTLNEYSNLNENVYPRLKNGDTINNFVLKISDHAIILEKVPDYKFEIQIQNAEGQLKPTTATEFENGFYIEGKITKDGTDYYSFSPVDLNNVSAEAQPIIGTFAYFKALYSESYIYYTPGTAVDVSLFRTDAFSPETTWNRQYYHDADLVSKYRLSFSNQEGQTGIILKELPKYNIELSKSLINGQEHEALTGDYTVEATLAHQGNSYIFSQNINWNDISEDATNPTTISIDEFGTGSDKIPFTEGDLVTVVIKQGSKTYENNDGFKGYVLSITDSPQSYKSTVILNESLPFRYRTDSYDEAGQPKGASGLSKNYYMLASFDKTDKAGHKNGSILNPV